MSGFLDKKSRFLDTIVTTEGRKQIAFGKMQAEFYSFSDSGTFYELNTSPSGSVDASKRLYLEASNLPQDLISFESDDSGKLINFKNSDNFVRNGKIISISTGSNGLLGNSYDVAENDIFTGKANELLSGSLDSFKKCYILGSPDVFNENRDQFILGTQKISFTISDESPFESLEGNSKGNIESTDGLFVDSKLSHLPNFQYLPPVNKQRPGENTLDVLGNYPNISQKPKTTFQDVLKEIKEYQDKGFSKEVIFEETSTSNNIFCQFFEIGGNEIIKLDVIDFGVFTEIQNDGTQSERTSQGKDITNRVKTNKHVFFAGKVFTDSNGIHKFINLFTLVFEN